LACESTEQKRSTTLRRPNIQPQFITDFGYADGIAFLAKSVEEAQDFLSRVEASALKVGLRINRAKTEYILAGKWSENDLKNKLSVNTYTIARVDDFKYLGSWILSPDKDFEVRRGLAWDAAKKMTRVWKSQYSSSNFKYRLFRATIESILLYGSEAWIMSPTFLKKFEGSYSALLRFALDVKWETHTSNEILFKHRKTGARILVERRLGFIGHFYRTCHRTGNQAMKSLILQEGSNNKDTFGGKRQGGSRDTYVTMLMRNVHVSSAEELANLMLDRNRWNNIINGKNLLYY